MKMQNKITWWLIAGLVLLQSQFAVAATTLLPNGKQCFSNANGPIISGSVLMYIPATTTKKNTWQDSAQVTLNTNPIQLDGNACAVIYGVGQYRQELYDGPVVAGSVTGNLVWDQLTTDTSAFNAIFWSGLAGGTPNAITIVDTGFNGTDGSVINFTALSTNTGATTLNPSGFGNVPINKSTTAGPTALVGGEIVATNQVSVIYSSSANTFTILNPPIQSASGSTAPRCGMSTLKIFNDAVSPNTVIDITASDIVTSSSAALVVNRQNISTTINTSLGNVTSAVGGMDGEAPGTSAWLNIFLVDNGAAAGAIASLAAGNNLAPVLPSGYIYSCFAGTARVDSSGNLLRIRQLGQDTQYVITAATNTTIAPIVVSGISGSTFSTTSPVLASISLAAFIPPNASMVRINAFTHLKNATLSDVLIAPSTSWGGTNNGPLGTAGQIWPYFGDSAINASTSFWMLLESQSIGWAADQAGGGMAVIGWKNGGVNAN